MGLVSFVVAVVAGAALAGGAGVLLVEQNRPDRVIEQQRDAGQRAAEPKVLDYGNR